MVRFNSLEYFILFFILVVCLGVLYGYESILVILINIFLINIKFVVKY
jgi:hypothetical protein